MTVVNEPAPRLMIHAPAWSQLPMCGSANTTPRPDAIWSNAVCTSPSSRMPSMSRPAGITGSRNTSSQYRAYERIDSLDSARSWPPSAAGPPSTRHRLASKTCTRGPWRRQAMSAAVWNAHRAQDSGTRHTTDQPRPYPASISLSLSPGIRYLLRPSPGGPQAPAAPV